MHINYKIITLFSLIAVITCCIVCSDNNAVSGDTDLNLPFLVKVVAPDTIYYETSEEILLMVHTETRLQSDVSYLIMWVYDGQYSSVISHDTLYDKADLGDIVPKDGVYSRLINSTQLAVQQPGEYIIEFSHPDIQEALLDTILFIGGEKNTSPVLSNLVLPGTVSIDMPDVDNYIFVDVIDPQGETDIVEVEGRVYFPYSTVPDLDITLRHKGIPQDILPNENSYVYIFKPDDIAHRGAGEYSFLFTARDINGNVSNALHGSISFLSDEENLPPVVEWVRAPDTVAATVGTFLIEVKVSDVNGSGDIKLVYFDSYLPDGNPSQSNPFYLFDDGGELSISGGNSGDKVKGDGIYSRTVMVPQTANGSFRFVFYAVDNINNTSESVEHIVVVE